MCKFMCPLLNLQQQGSMYKITGENCESLLAIKHIACDVRLLDPLLTLGVLRVTVVVLCGFCLLPL